MKQRKLTLLSKLLIIGLVVAAVFFGIKSLQQLFSVPVSPTEEQQDKQQQKDNKPNTLGEVAF